MQHVRECTGDRPRKWSHLPEGWAQAGCGAAVQGGSLVKGLRSSSQEHELTDQKDY